MPDRLAALVVTFNRLDQLRQTTDRLLQAAPRDLDRVLVVDNASTDGTADWLAGRDDPRLEVLRLPENRGGAGGFEAGLRHLSDARDPDWIVVMDDDARPAPGALAAFRAGDRAGHDAWAAAVFHPRGAGGAICEMNRPWTNPFWRGDALGPLRRGRAAFHLADPAYRGDGPVAVDAATFVGLFLSRRAVALAGFPDGRMFLYGDDILYTLGLAAAGGRIAFDPGLVWEHDCASLGPGPQVFRPLWKTYYHHRNLALVYRRAAGPWSWLLLPAVLPKWALKARWHGGQRRAYLRLLARAVRDGLGRRLDARHDDIVRLAGR